eukprot:gene1975-biopygen4812
MFTNFLMPRCRFRDVPGAEPMETTNFGRNPKHSCRQNQLCRRRRRLRRLYDRRLADPGAVPGEAELLRVRHVALLPMERAGVADDDDRALRVRREAHLGGLHHAPRGARQYQSVHAISSDFPALIRHIPSGMPSSPMDTSGAYYERIGIAVDRAVSAVHGNLNCNDAR